MENKNLGFFGKLNSKIKQVWVISSTENAGGVSIYVGFE